MKEKNTNGVAFYQGNWYSPVDKDKKEDLYDEILETLKEEWKYLSEIINF
ncbi:hypothetical protein ACJA25_03315 [Mycoplasmopsis hyopharyngis]